VHLGIRVNAKFIGGQNQTEMLRNAGRLARNEDGLTKPSGFKNKPRYR